MTINNDNNSKFEIKAINNNIYEVTYHEFYKSCGWRMIGVPEIYTKEAVEFEFDITI